MFRENEVAGKSFVSLSLSPFHVGNCNILSHVDIFGNRNCDSQLLSYMNGFSNRESINTAFFLVKAFSLLLEEKTTLFSFLPTAYMHVNTCVRSCMVSEKEMNLLINQKFIYFCPRNRHMNVLHF